VAKADSSKFIPKDPHEMGSHTPISIFQAILDSSTDPISAFDTDSRLIAFNTAFAEIMLRQYGIVLREGMKVTDSLPESERPFFRDLQQKVLVGESVDLERKFDHPSGEKLFIEFCGYPLKENSQIVGGSIYARDVSAKRRNERELQLLFEQSPLPMWLVDVETLHFVRVNKAACTHYGYSEAEFLRMTPLDLRTPEEAIEFEKDVVPVIRKAQDLTFQLSEHVKKNGERITVEVRSHIIQDGKRLLRLAHVLDVTDKLAAEHALKEANDRFELATKATLSSIFEIDLATGHVVRSNGLKTLLGFEPEEAESTLEWWRERIHPDDLVAANSALSQGTERSDIAEVEYRVRHRDGHYITVWDRGIVVRDKDGKPVRVFSSTTDVSDRARIKRELQRSNERFQLATHAVTAMIYELDLATGISERSSSMATLTGFGIDEIPTTVDWWFTRLHPDDVERTKTAIERSIESHSDIYECEYRFQHKAGHYITIWDRGVIARDENDRAVRIVGSTQDITRRRNIEQELESANERFRLASEAVNATIYDWDLNSGYCHYSSGLERLLGFSEAIDGEVHESGWYMSRVHPDDAAQISTVLESALIEGHQYELEYRMRHRDGHYVYVWDRGIVLRDDDGLATRIVGSVQDVSAKKIVEAELIEQRNRALTAKESADEMNRLKSTFFANMSHEIRTPLTAILGFTEVLRENLKDSPDARFADIIEANSKRLLQTLNGILDLARIEATRINLEPRLVDVNAEVERIVMLLEPLASKRNLDLSFQASSHAPRAFIDEGYLDQILTNLVSNAIKFTSAGSVNITVRSASELVEPIEELPGFYRYYSSPAPTTDHFEIVVADTGVGIPREDIGLIFDEFRQVSSGHNRRLEGSGLGLTISSKLAHAMGGSIEARSVQRLGSQFILSLPKNLPSAPAESRDNGTVQTESISGRRPTILLVEDNASMAEMTQAMIGKRATLLHGASTTEARNILESVTPDLILMDINLGEEMTGLDFTRELKAKGLGQYSRIVALTAYALPKDRLMALEAGCDDYLAKPFSKSVLLEMIEKNLAERAKLLSTAMSRV
jgi:PAS domain S-box-containing protein